MAHERPGGAALECSSSKDFFWHRLDRGAARGDSAEARGEGVHRGRAAAPGLHLRGDEGRALAQFAQFARESRAGPGKGAQQARSKQGASASKHGERGVETRVLWPRGRPAPRPAGAPATRVCVWGVYCWKL